MIIRRQKRYPCFCGHKLVSDIRVVCPTPVEPLDQNRQNRESPGWAFHGCVAHSQRNDIYFCLGQKKNRSTSIFFSEKVNSANEHNLPAYHMKIVRRQLIQTQRYEGRGCFPLVRRASYLKGDGL